MLERSGDSSTAPPAASLHPPTWRTRNIGQRCGFLSFAGHAYVGRPTTGCDAATAIGTTLARVWLNGLPIASALLRVLCTRQLRRLDKTKPIQLDNIVLLQNFLGGLDEEWFVVVHIQIEREAGPGRLDSCAQ